MWRRRRSTTVAGITTGTMVTATVGTAVMIMVTGAMEMVTIVKDGCLALSDGAIHQQAPRLHVWGLFYGWGSAQEARGRQNT